MNVKRCADCGNSPKNAFAEDFAVGLFSADEAVVTRKLTPHATWDVVGAARLNGSEEIVSRLVAVDGLEVTTVVTHGRVGAVAGIVTRGAVQARFTLIIRFASAKADTVSLIELYSPTPHAFGVA